MKKILQYILLTIFLSGTLLSCEKNYVVDKTDKKMVLNSTFSPDSRLLLNLSNTKDPYSNDTINSIAGASISIIADNETISDYNYLGEGYYLVNFIPKSKISLKIKVEKEGYNSISATTYIPKKILFWGLETEIIANNENEKNINYKFIGYSSKNLYLIIKHIVYKESVTLNNDTISYIDTVAIQGKESFFDSVLPPYAISKSIFAKINPGAHFISFQSYDGFVKSDNLVKGISQIEIYICSEEYYNYQKSLALYKWNKHEVNTSILNSNELFSNIDNGLGIFAGFNKRILLDTFK